VFVAHKKYNPHQSKISGKIATSSTQQVTWQESPAVAREDAQQTVQFLLQSWPSRSSKIDDFHLTWKCVCDFLLVIYNNIGPIAHRLAAMHPLQTDDGHTDDRRQLC